MSSSNYRRNKAAIDEFRKALKAEIDDLSEIDVKVLNKAVNEGIRWLKDGPDGQTSESGYVYH
ncbi:MAG: hypothetical protein ACLT76_00800 [Clostridium fessum]